jgi:ketosteroid isomerase-like protein
MSTEDEVRAVSGRFYSALNGLDISQLADVWSQSNTVTTMHPMGGEQVGWPEVRKSFEDAAGAMSDIHVELADQQIRTGEDLAYEIGIERGRGKVGDEQIEIEHRVTNVYRREGGQWKMVHHHTDVSPGMVEVLQRLQAA